MTLSQDDVDRLVHSMRENQMGLSVLAKWILGIGGSVLTLVLTAQSVALTDMKTDLALLQRDMSNLTKSLDTRMGDRFTGSDAKAMRDLYDLRLKSVTDEIERHRIRLEQLEKGQS